MDKSYIIGKGIWKGLLWYIFIVSVYKVTEDIAQFSFNVLKNTKTSIVFLFIFTRFGT